MSTFEESALNMFEKLINRIGELEAKVSKTEEPTKPTAEVEKPIEYDPELIKDILRNM